jgi:hypothetical protein
LLEIPEESLDEYVNREEIAKALRAAVRDDRRGCPTTYSACSSDKKQS